MKDPILYNKDGELRVRFAKVVGSHGHRMTLDDWKYSGKYPSTKSEVAQPKYISRFQRDFDRLKCQITKNWRFHTRSQDKVYGYATDILRETSKNLRYTPCYGEKPKLYNKIIV